MKEQAIKFMQGTFENLKVHKTLARIGKPDVYQPLTAAGERTSISVAMAGILGFINFYRQFISLFAQITLPITNLLKTKGRECPNPASCSNEQWNVKWHLKNLNICLQLNWS